MPRQCTEQDSKAREWPDNYPTYMRPWQAARYTGQSESTLAKLRMRHNRKNGPKFIKTGSVVTYRRADLDAWLNEHTIEGEGAR